MSKREEELLLSAQRSALTRAQEQFHKKDMDAARSALEEVHISDEILAATRSQRRRRIVPIFLMATPLACIGLIAVLLAFSPTNNALLCTVQSTQATLAFESPWILQDALNVQWGEFTIEGSGLLDFPIGVFRDTIVGSITVRFDSSGNAGKITRFVATDSISYRASSGAALRILTWGQNSEITLQTVGHVSVEINDYNRDTLIEFEGTLSESQRLLTFTSDGNQTMKISTAPSGQWDIQTDFVTRIGFTDDRPTESGLDGGSMFLSTVRDGLLKLTDVSKNVALFRGHHLQFEGLEATVHTTITDDLESSIIGYAECIKVGPARSMKEVTPNLFTLYLHSDELPLWITIISFIGGVVWSARRLFARS